MEGNARGSANTTRASVFVYNLAHGVLAGEAGRFSLVGDYTNRIFQAKTPTLVVGVFAFMGTTPRVSGRTRGWGDPQSEDLTGEDFLEVGVHFERFGAVAGKCATFVGSALFERGGEKSAEVVEVHFALLVDDARMARSGAGQRGGCQVPDLAGRLLSL